MSWLFALAGLALGGVAGYLLARRFGESEQRATALEKELERSREEHAAYRREVSDHFAKTAVAVNQLTDSYRNVHQQLSDGARALCDNAAAETALAFDQSRLIDAPATEPPARPEETSPEETQGDGTERRASDAPPPKETEEAAEAQANAAEQDAEPDGTPDAAPTDPAERGGASWTPAASAADPEPVRPPRDYADDETGVPRSASKS